MQLPGWRGGVDAFAKPDERNAKRLKSSSSVIRCFRLRPSRSSRQHTTHIEPPPLGVREQLIERGPTVLAPDTPGSTNSTAVQPRAST